MITNCHSDLMFETLMSYLTTTSLDIEHFQILNDKLQYCNIYKSCSIFDISSLFTELKQYYAYFSFLCSV